MSSPPPETSARRRPENLGILLREPFRIGSELLHDRFAERGHAEVRPPHGNVFQFLDDSGTRVSVLAQREPGGAEVSRPHSSARRSPSSRWPSW